jgi:hypothetical protein
MLILLMLSLVSEIATHCRYQMLQALAEQPVGFDQDGAERGHGRLSPKALMIERQSDPRRCGVARSTLRWRNTAQKRSDNKDKINTI